MPKPFTQFWSTQQQNTKIEPSSARTLLHLAPVIHKSRFLLGGETKRMLVIAPCPLFAIGGTPLSPLSIAKGRKPPSRARGIPRTRKSLSARNPPNPRGPKAVSLLSNTSAKRNPSEKDGFPRTRKNSSAYFSIWRAGN